jgi:hypothetical protein
MNGVEVKKCLKIELGFLIIDLIVDTFIDIVSSLFQSSFEQIYWSVNLKLFIVLIFCISTIGFTIFNLASTVKERFFKACAITQVLYMFTIGLKGLGHSAEIIPKYWKVQWISAFHVASSFVVPNITLLIILYRLYLNDKKIFEFFPK